MFTELLNMSISASWVVLVVILLRLVLRKAPKSIHCALWLLVAIRLLCPLSLESEFSLMPTTEAIPETYLYMEPQMHHAEAVIHVVDNPAFPQQVQIPTNQTVSVVQTKDVQWTLIWFAGMCVMVLYAFISYLIVRRSVQISIALDRTVQLCDHINTPFILGIIRPKIYLPSQLDPVTAAHVLAHEQVHLKRRDHWWKPLGFALLSVYWFNPMIWLAYVLLCRDIELACDEQVIKDLDAPNKKAYSMALLECSVPRRMISACPLAFGESDVKRRIKSVLSYKKPAFWIIAVSIIACIAASVCFLTDPATETEDWEEACREVLEDIQRRDRYHITVSGQYEGESFLNDTSFNQYYKSGDTLMHVCHIPADGSTTGYLKKNEQYYESITYDGSMDWEETGYLEERVLTPWLVYFQYDDSKVDAISRKEMDDSYYIRLNISEPADDDMRNSSCHVDFYFDREDNFLYAVQTVHGGFADRPNSPHTRTMTMTVSDTPEEEIHNSLEHLTQTDYRLAVGTYVPISSETDMERERSSLSLAQAYRYDVTEDSFIIHDLKSGDVTRYQVDWGWKGYTEADERAPILEFARLTQSFGVLKPVLDNHVLKYQYVSEDCHLLNQDGVTCLVIAERKPNSDLISWRVHSLVPDHPLLLPPKSFPEAVERINEVNNVDAFNRSGNCRPGRFDMTEDEAAALRKILSEMPSDAFTPHSRMPDIYTYYIGISCYKNSSNAIGFSFSIYYDYEQILLVWYDKYTQQQEVFEIRYDPLQAFLERMMQPERIDDYYIMVDLDHPAYISYTHEDVTVQLVQVAGWEYEIVPYVDDHTDFGIRCKPEWLDDWLFFGYMHGELIPESTFLHEAKIPDSQLQDTWHYLFESPIEGSVSWREWPESWKMIYCYADDGTYYIYNEGSFDERLAEHDRGGYNFMEASFAGTWAFR